MFSMANTEAVLYNVNFGSAIQHLSAMGVGSRIAVIVFVIFLLWHFAFQIDDDGYWDA